jgi:protein ImuB
MMALLKEKLADIDAGFGVDLLRLDALRVGRREALQNGFAESEATPFREPQVLADRLSNRFGSAAVTVLAPRASHIAERSQIQVPALEALASRSPQLAYAPPWPYPPGPARPAFMLARPEPIDVIAEVPDGPPARFVWRRVERRVARAEGPERIAPEWWRTLYFSDDQKRPRPRDYYRIEDNTGAAYWVFRHGLYGGEEESEPPSWFLHGLFA